jgi:two-component system sensor kinase FixL
MVITHCNAATASVFGYTLEELVGQRVNVLIQPQESQHHEGYDIQNFLLYRFFTKTTGALCAERTGEKNLATLGRTVTGRHKDGTLLTLQLTTTSTSTGYAAVFVNMTDQVETERRALAAERGKAEAERGMKEFLVSPK